MLWYTDFLPQWLLKSICLWRKHCYIRHYDSSGYCRRCSEEAP